MNTQVPAGEPHEATQSTELDQLVVDCLERVEREGLVAVLAVCAEHPEHSDDLRRRIARLLAVGLLELVLSNERPPRS